MDQVEQKPAARLSVRFPFHIAIVVMIMAMIGVTVFFMLRWLDTNGEAVTIESAANATHENKNSSVRYIIPELVNYIPANPAAGDGSIANPYVVMDAMDVVYQKLSPQMIQILDRRTIWGNLEVIIQLPDNVITNQYRWLVYYDYAPFDPLNVFDANQINQLIKEMEVDGSVVMDESEQRLVVPFAEEDASRDLYMVILVRAEVSDGQYVYLIYGKDSNGDLFFIPGVDPSQVMQTEQPSIEEGL